MAHRKLRSRWASELFTTLDLSGFNGRPWVVAEQGEDQWVIGADQSLNINMATSILKNMTLSYGLSRMTESVWPSIEILASILSPGLTLFRTLVSSRSSRRNSLPA